MGQLTKLSQDPHFKASLIQENAPLADKNWFKTGGNARFYAQPCTKDEFSTAIKFANAHKIPIFILGSGANTLFSDEGFDGLVIKPNLKDIVMSSEDTTHVYLQAGAGVYLAELIEYCLDHGFSGLEEFSGIPGTVGGAVFINLHYFEFLLEQFLTEAHVVEKDTGTIKTVPTSWFHFGYNDSTLLKQEHFLISATFKLKKSSAQEIAYAKGRIKEIIRHRAARYPQQNTCGSFFRNFYPTEVSLERNGTKIIWVAYYLDKLGIKGSLQFGDAIVSHKHANMIVNQGNATSTDIISLAKTMQSLVKQEFNIIPQPECRLIGFKQYPLL